MLRLPVWLCLRRPPRSRRSLVADLAAPEATRGPGAVALPQHPGRVRPHPSAISRSGAGGTGYRRRPPVASGVGPRRSSNRWGPERPRTTSHAPPERLLPGARPGRDPRPDRRRAQLRPSVARPCCARSALWRRWARSTAVATLEGSLTPSKVKSESSVPAVSKSTAPTRKSRSIGRLAGVDVLDAVDPRLLDALGEDPAPDDQPVGRDREDREDPLDEAREDREREDDDEHGDAERVAGGEPEDRAERERDQEAGRVEGLDRAPARVAVVDDLLAGVQFERHAGQSTAAAPPGYRRAGAGCRPGRADHDGSRAARAVRLRAPRRASASARCSWSRSARQEILGVVTGARRGLRARPRRAARACSSRRCPADLVALAPWIAAEYCSTPARAFSLMLPPEGVRARTALHARALRPPEPGERLSDAQRALLAALPRADRRRSAGAAAPGGPRPRRDRAARRAARARPHRRRRARERRAAPADGGRRRAVLADIEARRPRRAPAAARRHRLGQDRGLPARRRAHARRGPHGARARARRSR